MPDVPPQAKGALQPLQLAMLECSFGPLPDIDAAAEAAAAAALAQGLPASEVAKATAAAARSSSVQNLKLVKTMEALRWAIDRWEKPPNPFKFFGGIVLDVHHIEMAQKAYWACRGASVVAQAQTTPSTPPLLTTETPRRCGM